MKKYLGVKVLHAEQCTRENFHGDRSKGNLS